MRLFALALLLQGLALFLAWLNSPGSLLLAGALALCAILLRARLVVRVEHAAPLSYHPQNVPAEGGHPWGEL